MIDTMKALVRRGGRVELADVPVPSGDAIVEVAFAGICRTDLAVASGELPVAEGRVLGHELSGWCDGVPVSVIPFVGASWLGVDRDGAFAERVAVPRAALVPLPASLSMELGAYVEPVAAALAVLPFIQAGTRVVIGGTGRIAELTARVVVAAGGVRVDGDADVAIEHDGTVDLALLRDRGTLLLKSRARRHLALPAGELVARELVVRGVSHGSFPDAVAWLHTGRIAVSDLLAPPRALADFAAAFAAPEAKKQLFAIA